jgi:hypothetical protein
MAAARAQYTAPRPAKVSFRHHSIGLTVDDHYRRMVSSRSRSEAWCSGLTCSPVKAETAGSNPVASASSISTLTPLPESGAVLLFLPVRVPMPGQRSASLACLVRSAAPSPSHAPPTRRYVRRARSLTPNQEAKIGAVAGSESLRSLAARFGVSHETVRSVLRRVLAEREHATLPSPA